MNIGDYISDVDLPEITSSEYQQLRYYVRLLGHKVSEEYGEYCLYGGEGYYLMLWPDGDIAWARDDEVKRYKGRRLSIEEVKRMIALCP